MPVPAASTTLEGVQRKSSSIWTKAMVTAKATAMGVEKVAAKVSMVVVVAAVAVVLAVLVLVASTVQCG